MENLPQPQSRIEVLLDAFIRGDTSKVTEPQSRIEDFWYFLIKGTNSLPIPQSRTEELMKKIIENDDKSIPLAYSRTEEFLIAMLTGEIDNLSKPESRKEEYLSYIARHNLIVGNIEYVTYKGTNIVAQNTVKKPFKSAILKGKTGYSDKDTGEILEAFEEGRNLELVSVRVPVLKTTTNSFFNAKDGDLIIGRMSNGISNPNNKYGVILREDLFFDAIPNKYCWFYPSSNSGSNGELYFYDKDYNFIKKVNQYTLVPENARYMKFSYGVNRYTTQDDIDLLLSEARIGYFDSWNPNPKYDDIPTFKTNILTVNEDVELRSIGDVTDTLDLMAGKYVQNVGEILLDGSEAWFSDGVYFYHNSLKPKNKNAICDKIVVDKIKNHNPTTTVVTFSGGGNLEIFVQDVSTKEEFLNWLSVNKPRFIYELSEKSVKTVDLNIVDQDNNKVDKLSAFDDVTHIISSSENGSLLAEVEVSVPTKMLESLNEVKTALADVKVESDIVGTAQKIQDVNSLNTMVALTEVYELALKIGDETK